MAVRNFQITSDKFNAVGASYL